jgi:hypothetical protein
MTLQGVTLQEFSFIFYSLLTLQGVTLQGYIKRYHFVKHVAAVLRLRRVRCDSLRINYLFDKAGRSSYRIVFIRKPHEDDA